MANPGGAPAMIYQRLLANGVDPTGAAALTAIAGRESGYNASAESGYRPGTGDFFSTGLFQENLGAAYGPGGTPGKYAGTQDIHGGALAKQFGTKDPYGALYGNVENDVRAAAQLYKTGGLAPWKAGQGNWSTNIGQNFLQGAVDASGGQVTMAQLLAAGGGGGGGAGQVLPGMAAGNLQGGAGVAIAQGTQQDQNLRNQQALNQAVAQLTADFARTESGFQEQLLGVSQAQLGIQRDRLGRLGPEHIAQRALQHQGNVLSLQGLNAQEENTRWTAGQSVYNTQLQYNQQFKDMASQGAGSGTMFTGGHRDQTQLAHQQEISQLSGIRHQEGVSIAQAERSKKGVGLSEKGEILSFNEQMAGLKDEKKNLDMLALRYGISANEIKSRLAHSLQQTGLSAQMTGSDLAMQLANTDIGIWSQYNQAVAPPIQGVYGIGGGGSAPGGGGASYQR